MATTEKTSKIEEVRKEVDRLNSAARTADQLMEAITLLLHEKMLKYNWVGFYMLEPAAHRCSCWDITRER
jgi:putative methionine-R-sulfoxide reductase with GAF domain